MIGKLLAQTIALPVKAVVALPDVAAEAIEEIGKAFDPPKDKRGR